MEFEIFALVGFGFAMAIAFYAGRRTRILPFIKPDNE
jgi:hypothetical protein